MNMLLQPNLNFNDTMLYPEKGEGKCHKTGTEDRSTQTLPN